MIDDSYLIFNEELEPYEQYPGKNELFEELQFTSMVVGSCHFGWGVSGYLVRNIAGRLILGSIVSGAKYKISKELFDYVKGRPEDVLKYAECLRIGIEKRLMDKK